MQWPLSVMEDYTRQIKTVCERSDLTDHESFCKIFEYVREIHSKSRMQGVEEAKQVIIRRIMEEL
jgi:hypothetical protein